MPDVIKILVGDDDDLCRRALSKMLERRGYAVLDAQDGEAVLECALIEEPDLILLDVSMPKMDGYVVCEQLRSNGRTEKIPVIMMTGAAMGVDSAIQGLRAGADEYLNKPIDAEALFDCIDTFLPPQAAVRQARILVVDDSRVNLQVMEGYLDQTGYRIELATNGADALALAWGNPPDVVLLDVQMPGMDGYEVCAQLKRDPRTTNVPIMFVTANALDDREMLKGYELGAVDYLRKPFLRDELLARLQVMVRLKQHQAELERKAYLDSLTGLPNRRHLSDRLEEELARARRHTHELSVLLLDLDHFKEVNDTHGHDAGDHVLAEIGRLLGKHVRQEDVVGRYGGEEFAFVLPETGLAPAVLLAQRIRRSVADYTMSYEGTAISMSASIGAASFPMLPIESSRELLRYADEALYRAKRSGRNQVQAYEPPDSV